MVVPDQQTLSASVGMSQTCHERTFVLECSNADQGLKLHREQVEALRPVHNAFGQLDLSSSRH